MIRQLRLTNGSIFNAIGYLVDGECASDDTITAGDVINGVIEDGQAGEFLVMPDVWQLAIADFISISAVGSQ